MIEWLNDSMEFLTQGWVLQLFLIVFGMGLASILLRRLIDVLERQAAKTMTPLDEALVRALRRPLRLLIWIIGLSMIVALLLGQSRYAEWIPKAQQLSALWLLGWFLISLARSYSEVLKSRQSADLDEDLYLIVTKVLQIAVIATIGLVTLQTFGISITGLLTFGGVGGLVVGFAAKDLLGNLFGGLMLHMDRPFRVGDWIRSPDRNLEGTVVTVGWRQTCLRTHSRNFLYVPNGIFMNIVIENPARMTHRMIRTVIGLRYEDLDRMKGVVEEVEQMLKTSPKVDQQQPVLVRFDAFNDSSVDFFLQCYTRTVDRANYTKIKQELLLAVADIIKRNGADIAYPTRTIYTA